MPIRLIATDMDGTLLRSDHRTISPRTREAFARARAEGIDASGPISADTVFHRAYNGAFDLVVAQYHDQGHIPIKLVARGMRLLKREINSRLVNTALAADEVVKAILYADRLIDIAFEEMSAAFVHSRDSGVKVDEGFRLFAAGQNLSLEREKQVSALLDWENRIFRALATEMPLDESSAIENSAPSSKFTTKDTASARPSGQAPRPDSALIWPQLP